MSGYSMNSEIARIHREGVILELEQLGLELGSKYSQEWFEEVWERHKGIKVPGFIVTIGGETMVYVDQKYHRKGIGSILIDDTTEVWVLDGNKMAEGFYSKNGFYKTKITRKSVIFDHELAETLWTRHESN